MRVLHVGASDAAGGAARATYRVHRSLVDHAGELGVESLLRVIRKESSDVTVMGGPPEGQSRLMSRLHSYLTMRAKNTLRTGNPTLHSSALFATGLGLELERLRKTQFDLINLHWLGDITLSIEEIGHLPEPIVWRLPDQWAFCGAEHYTSPPLPGEVDSMDQRFVLGYSASSRPSHESGPDLNRRTWLRKQRSFKKPMHLVCTTSWLADCARRSLLMRDWPVSVIPNPLDLCAYAPMEAPLARNLHQLPQDRPLILFGALGGIADFRKGADLLFDALGLLRQKVAGTALEHLELVIFGSDKPQHPHSLASLFIGSATCRMT